MYGDARSHPWESLRLHMVSLAYFPALRMTIPQLGKSLGFPEADNQIDSTDIQVAVTLQNLSLRTSTKQFHGPTGLSTKNL